MDYIVGTIAQKNEVVFYDILTWPPFFSSFSPNHVSIATSSLRLLAINANAVRIQRRSMDHHIPVSSASSNVHLTGKMIEKR